MALFLQRVERLCWKRRKFYARRDSWKRENLVLLCSISVDIAHQDQRRRRTRQLTASKNLKVKFSVWTTLSDFVYWSIKNDFFNFLLFFIVQTKVAKSFTSTRCWKDSKGSTERGIAESPCSKSRHILTIINYFPVRRQQFGPKLDSDGIEIYCHCNRDKCVRSLP